MEEYIPKVGDTVRIIRSDKNWNASMDEYIGTIQIIKEINDDSSYKLPHVSFVSKENSSINNYYWRHSEGHFVPYEKKSIKFKLKI